MEQTQKVEEVKAEEKLAEADKFALEKVVLQRKLAIAEAEKCELAHNHIVLQIFMKYGMDPAADAIDDQGVIKRGAAKKQ
jgi:hypothetical protein